MAKKIKENKILFGDVNDFTEPEEQKEKPTKNSTKGSLKLFSFLNDERFLKSLGITMILFSLFLLIAGLSFLLTWQADQSLVKTMTFGFFQLADEQSAQNALGMLGAWLGFVFFYKGFGIASFAFCLIFTSIGIYLLTKLQPIPIFKTLRYSFFAVIWLSLLLGFVFNQSYQILGGVFGHFGIIYLQNLLGNIGTTLFLLAYILVFAVAIFNIEFYHPGVKLKSEHIFENGLAANQSEKEEEKLKTNIVEGSITMADNLDLPPLKEEDFIMVERPMEDLKTSVIEEFPQDEQAPEIPTFVEPPIIAKQTEPTEQPLKTDSGLILEVKDLPEEEEEVLPTHKKHFGIDEAYDPTLEFSGYKFPTIDLLTDYGENKSKMDTNELSEKTRMIEETLKNYSIGIKKISATVGPTVTLYEIIPQDGVRIAKIKNLEDDIALSLAALGIRIIAPIPGKGTIGIEVPNANPSMVSMKSAIASPKFQQAEMELPIALGKTISNETLVVDLAKMPHLLMAGATGQGKSVGLNAVLTSLLYKKHPAEVKFVLVDPKKVELTLFNKIERHYLAKLPDTEDAIITDNNKVINTLNSLCLEMDNRYSLLKDAMVRNIKEYNEKFKARKLNPEHGHRFLPYIVLVVDEFADLIMTAGKEVETPIARLAQLARAIGIHLIIATQRPSVNVITGMIKANFPARIAFRVTSKIDSRTILDSGGADQLIGRGDLLFSNGNDLVRVQCAFVDTPEVEKIVEYIGSQKAYASAYLLPEYIGEDGGSVNLEFDITERDSMFREAAEIIVTAQQGSASLLQRKLKLGYNRAGRLIDQLEAAGIVGPFEGSKARNVNIPDLTSLEQFFNNEQNNS